MRMASNALMGAVPEFWSGALNTVARRDLGEPAIIACALTMCMYRDKKLKEVCTTLG